MIRPRWNFFCATFRSLSTCAAPAASDLELLAAGDGGVDSAADFRGVRRRIWWVGVADRSVVEMGIRVGSNGKSERRPVTPCFFDRLVVHMHAY